MTETFTIDACEEAFVRDFCPYKGSPDPLVVWRAAWQSALAAKQWQPIATAPKGGALVDILNDGRRYAGCHYDRICDEFRHITACGTLVRLKQATHWMPVPAPLPEDDDRTPEERSQRAALGL